MFIKSQTASVYIRLNICGGRHTDRDLHHENVYIRYILQQEHIQLTYRGPVLIIFCVVPPAQCATPISAAPLQYLKHIFALLSFAKH